MRINNEVIMISLSIILGSIIIADAIREVNGYKPWISFGIELEKKTKSEGE